MTNPTPTDIYAATWLPHPAPRDQFEEVLAPWTALGGRVLTCVRTTADEFFVLAHVGDRVTESWKVLL